MGDGHLNFKASKNPKITIESTQKEYLEQLDEKLGILATGVKKSRTAEQSAEKARNSGFDSEAKGKNYSDIYRLSTRSHPQLKQFESWYEEGKVYPELSLTPTILKHWYAGDGAYQNTHVKIALTNEKENKEKIEEMFENENLPKPNTWVDETYGIAIWNKEEGEKLLEYMGNPPEGFSYKFE